MTDQDDKTTGDRDETTSADDVAAASLDPDLTIVQRDDSNAFGTTAQAGRLGRYRLIKQLGQGGQGAVYLAEDERIHRQVALKVLFGGLVHSTEARLRFEREAEATSRLDHPGIARVYELGEDKGIPFIAMELIEGETLAARLRAPTLEDVDAEATTAIRFDSDRTKKGAAATSGLGVGSSWAPRASSGQAAHHGTARFIAAAARALHAAHEAGLVHRDIKPGNIMVRPDGSPCILDFGLAHDENFDGVTLTASNDRFGTPAYMSPEQVRGLAREVDRRSDVWALGATLYECCTLRRAFDGVTRDRLFDQIKNEDPIAPRVLDPSIPRDLEAIIVTALDKDKNRRFATALGLAEDLRRFCDYEPIAARPAGRMLKSWRWLQRNRKVAAAGFMIVVISLAAAIVYRSKSKEADQARQQAEEESEQKSRALSAEIRERLAKETALADYDRLADVKRLEGAIAEIADFYPPGPALSPRLEAWQREHAPLFGRLISHRALLETLRAKALPPEKDGEEENGVSDLDSDPAVATDRTNASEKSFRFSDQTLQFQHDVLAELVRDLDQAATAEIGPVKMVERLIEQSRTIEQETITAPSAPWTDCIARIRKNPRYGGLEIRPQLGLIPLGQDPASGLEEFLHWLTHEGQVPGRDQLGRIAVTDDLGIILVLIPGGTTIMGSQSDDANAPNYSRDSRPDEQPPRRVTLAPFFMSKYEMTQAQWQRATQENPSQYAAGLAHPAFKEPVNAHHPVEHVSWEDCRRVLPRLDLILPTSAQWERAARADGTFEYAGCSDLSELAGLANLNGEETRVVGFSGQEPGFEDGFILHAPVGSLLPNAFGLHDMSGNVEEWCRDGWTSYDKEVAADDGRTDSRSRNRIVRGGSYSMTAASARLAAVGTNPVSRRSNVLGLRASRPLDHQ